MIPTKITREFLRASGACWEDEAIATLLPADGATLLEVLRCEDVSPDDRIWVATRKGAVPEKIQRLFAVWCARQALALVKEPDPRSVTACDVAERFTRGKASIEDLAAARAAAWAAAEDAARAAAEDAARAAAGAAAGAAAEDAAEDAARAAAWAAARAAAWAAQVAEFIRLMETES